MVDFVENGDGSDSVFNLKYRAVKISEAIPTVSPPVFFPNPYIFTPTAQFNGYPNQDWASFQKGSSIFYPNPHINQPFSSVSCVIHFKTPSPSTALMFLNMIFKKVQKDMRLVNAAQFRPYWGLGLVIFEQTGTVPSIFKLLGVFFDAIFSSFSEDMFNEMKYVLTSQLKSYNPTNSIEDITKNDQVYLENPSQPTIDSVLADIANYDFSTFLLEQSKFIDELSVEWLVVGIK